MDIRLYNARILPLTGSAEPMRGEVHVHDDVITHVGPEIRIGTRFDRVIDCGGNLLLPGFKNAHAHSAMVFLRSFADDVPLAEWLTQKVFPYERKLTSEACYWLNRLAILEYVSGGITAAFDMYFYRDAIAAAAIDAGFRMTMMTGANDHGGSAKKTEADYRKYAHLHPLINFQLGGHAEYTTSLPLLTDLAGLANDLRLPYYTHISETAAEVEGCIGRYGMRPYELFESIGAWNYGGGGFHSVHVSEDEMDIIKARGIYPITCPGSNVKLGSGVAPLTEYIARGIPVAIGTDGAASNNALDMFREMYLASCLQKVTRGPDKLDGADALCMACQNSARAMGLTNCDSLQNGKQADIILIDLDRPNQQPVLNPVKNLVYAGNKGDVLLTMIAGKVVYERGEYFVGEDPARIYFEAQSFIDRIKREV